MQLLMNLKKLNLVIFPQEVCDCLFIEIIILDSKLEFEHSKFAFEFFVEIETNLVFIRHLADLLSYGSENFLFRGEAPDVSMSSRGGNSLSR